MAAPLDIILQMIIVVFSNTFGTLLSLFGLFGNLTESLAFVSSLGPLGLVVAALVLAVVLYFLGRFFIKSWKLLVILFVVGLLLLWMLGLGGA